MERGAQYAAAVKVGVVGKRKSCECGAHLDEPHNDARVRVYDEGDGDDKLEERKAGARLRVGLGLGLG